jgi:hypothetical protein
VLIVDNHNRSAKRKKIKPSGMYPGEAKTPGFIALGRIPVQKWRCQQPPRALRLSPEIYRLSGLVSGLILLNRDSTTNSHA